MPRITGSIVSSIKRVVNKSKKCDRGGVEITRNAHMRIENKTHIRHSTYENIFIKTDKRNKRL